MKRQSTLGLGLMHHRLFLPNDNSDPIMRPDNAPNNGVEFDSAEIGLKKH